MLARSMDLNVVAEGVENKEQFEFLSILECPIYQGHHFYSAMTVNQLQKLLNFQSTVGVQDR